MFTARTTTSVHSPAAAREQRFLALGRERFTLASLRLYGQCFLGMALYLYDHVSTPGYLSLLMTLPFLLLLFFGAVFICRRGGVEALSPGLGRTVRGLLASAAWLDGVAALYGLCALVSDILPDFEPRWVGPAAVTVTAWALWGQRNTVLPALSRLFAALIAGCIGFCACTALPYAHSGHLSPVFGAGFGSIARGGLWMTGCGVSWLGAYLLPAAPGSRQALLSLEKRGRLSLCASLGLGVLTALLSANLLPFYALARPETTGWRLLLLTHVSPSLAGWSLLVTGVLLMLLLLLADSAVRGQMLLSRRENDHRVPLLWLVTALPLAAEALPETERLLLTLLPFRGAAVGAAVIFGTLGLRHRGKEPASHEADPGKEPISHETTS